MVMVRGNWVAAAAADQPKGTGIGVCDCGWFTVDPQKSQKRQFFFLQRQIRDSFVLLVVCFAAHIPNSSEREAMVDSGNAVDNMNASSAPVTAGLHQYVHLSGIQLETAVHSLRLVRERLGLDVRIDEENQNANVSFGSIGAAQDWVTVMVSTFADAGQLIGDEVDSLIIGFRGFRINMQLWHLLCYILEGKVWYTLPGDVWNIHHSIQPSRKRIEISQWLAKYLLTTDSWTAYNQLPMCPVCEKCRVTVDSPSVEVCLGCHTRMLRTFGDMYRNRMVLRNQVNIQPPTA